MDIPKEWAFLEVGERTEKYTLNAEVSHYRREISSKFTTGVLNVWKPRFDRFWQLVNNVDSLKKNERHRLEKPADSIKRTFEWPVIVQKGTRPRESSGTCRVKPK